MLKILFMLFSGSSQLVIGQYVPTGSIIHKLNPLLKLGLVFLLMLALFIFTRGTDYLIIAILGIGNMITACGQKGDLYLPKEKTSQIGKNSLSLALSQNEKEFRNNQSHL